MRRFRGCQIIGSIPFGTKVYMILTLARSLVPTDGINKSLKKILPYQDTQVPPCLLSPKYRSHHLCFPPCVGLSLCTHCRSSCHILWITPDSAQALTALHDLCPARRSNNNRTYIYGALTPSQALLCVLTGIQWQCSQNKPWGYLSWFTDERTDLGLAPLSEITQV